MPANMTKTDLNLSRLKGIWKTVRVNRNSGELQVSLLMTMLYLKSQQKFVYLNTFKPEAKTNSSVIFVPKHQSMLVTFLL